MPVPLQFTSTSGPLHRWTNPLIPFPIMQGDPGPSRSLDKKRKSVESSSSSSSSSVNNTAVVRGKKARKSNLNSPSATCDTGKIDSQWPAYFKEVSVREGILDLTPRTLHLSVVQGVCMVVTGIIVLDSDTLSLVYRYSRSAAYHTSML